MTFLHHIRKKVKNIPYIFWIEILCCSFLKHIDKRISLIFLFLLLCTTQLFAQPGEERACLSFNKIYDKNLNSIDVFSDTALQIRTFTLIKDKIYEETFMLEALLKMEPNSDADGSFILCTSPVNTNDYIAFYPNQRMFLVYKNDTMVIDFIEIHDKMDSLVIQKGYFKYSWPEKYKYDRNAQSFYNGLSPYTVKQMLDKGYIEYDPNTDCSFLAEQNLPASYFIMRAEHYLQYEQPNPALTDLHKAIQKNNGYKSYEILHLLCDAYTQTAEYEKAIENISAAMNCNTSEVYYHSNNEVFNYIIFENDKTIENNKRIEDYETRINLFIKLKMYDNALKDYDTIYAISISKTSIIVDRANFKIKFLKAYKSAISDLKITIDAMPADYLCESFTAWSPYYNTYFTLAMAEYYNGDKKRAFRHWLIAEELGYVGSNEVIHFDSLITKNPKIPELYLARSLARYKSPSYLDWDVDRKKIFNDALNDINKAKELGIKDYRINMYRAFILKVLEKYDEALVEINNAILKNNSDPRCFLIRYEIRQYLRQTKYGDNNDMDLQQYKIAAKKWRWEKY